MQPRTRHVAKTYSTTEAVRATGVTYRQLDYWASTDFIVPSVRGASPGQTKVYSEADIEQIILTKALLDIGVSLSAIRRIGPEKMVHVLRAFLRERGDLL